jgi:flagellar biosynthetic protein FliQ
MNPQDAIDLGREALNITLIIGAPVLLAGMAEGLLIGLLQAITQVQEQTVSFVPKLVAMVVVMSVLMPWLLHRMVEYSRDLFTNIHNTHQAEQPHHQELSGLVCKRTARGSLVHGHSVADDQPRGR